MLWLYYVFFLNEMSAQTEIFYSNGWTPITREKVFSVINKKIDPDIKFAQVFKEDQKQDNFENPENSIKLVEPLYINYNKNWNAKESSSEIMEEYQSNIAGAGINREERENKELQIVSTTERHRKAKDISSTFPNEANFLTQNRNQNLIYDDTSRDILVKDTNINRNRYQVTENSDFMELFKDDESNFSITKDPGYYYEKVNETSKVNIESSKNDFTSKLLNILSSYNIRVNDVLPNYELSRDTSNRSPPKQEFLLLPIPLKYSSRHNSLNHLAVDPLLAVFLSNYGYYLPGQYGLHNKYQNLYGYLASNNIHNNKPFGSYKLFSDTDSSN